MTPCHVLDACRTRLRRARGLVRPGVAGLLIGVECSRVRDSMDVPYIFYNYQNRHRTSCSTRKLPDRIVVGLQLYSSRTFHITLSPRYIRADRDPLEDEKTPNTIQTTTQDIGYYATRGPHLSKSLCSLHHRVPELSIPTYKSYC